MLTYAILNIKKNRTLYLAMVIAYYLGFSISTSVWGYYGIRTWIEMPFMAFYLSLLALPVGIIMSIFGPLILLPQLFFSSHPRIIDDLALCITVLLAFGSLVISCRKKNSLMASSALRIVSAGLLGFGCMAILMSMASFST